MRLGFLRHPIRIVEGEEKHAEGVKGGHEYAGQYRPVGQLANPSHAAHGSRFNNQILGPVPGEGGNTGQRQGANQHRDIGNRHVFPQLPHATDILISHHGVNDGARPQE